MHSKIAKMHFSCIFLMVCQSFSHSPGIQCLIKICVPEYLYRVLLFTRFLQKSDRMDQCGMTRETRPFSWPRNAKTHTRGLKAAQSTLSSIIFRCDHFAAKKSKIRQLGAKIEAIHLSPNSYLMNWHRR